jgi:acylphosphatase
MKARLHALVSGRVQGVFFRSSVADLAVSLGIKGWVRNLPDGRVETVLEGDKDSVEKIVNFCQRGPPGAHVTDVQLNWEEPRGEFSTFKILY